MPGAPTPDILRGMFYVSLAIAVTGLSVYHLSLKRAPHEVNPFIFLAIGYILAAVLCVASARLVGGKMPWEMASTSLFATFGMLAVGVLLIEIGVLLAYRHGWPLGTIGPVSNALAAAVLLPVAVVYYKDAISRLQAVGIVLVVAGLILITTRRPA
jgi:drug/metabolite transporter (DMT)-like permease